MYIVYMYMNLCIIGMFVDVRTCKYVQVHDVHASNNLWLTIINSTPASCLDTREGRCSSCEWGGGDITHSMETAPEQVGAQTGAKKTACSLSLFPMQERLLHMYTHTCTQGGLITLPSSAECRLQVGTWWVHCSPGNMSRNVIVVWSLAAAKFTE